MNAPDQTTRGRAGRVVATLLGAVTLFALSAVALLAWKTGLSPLELPWLDGGRPSALLLALLHEARYELAVLALAALNLALLLLLLSPSRERVASAPATGDTPCPLEAEREGGGDDAPGTDGRPETEGSATIASSDASIVSAVGARARSEAQLRIAASELSRLRRELSTCRVELEAANTVKSRFLANMSHELRTPMNGIVGMTDLLLGGELPPRERRFAESISASAGTLLGLIGDLLDFSRIEAGTLYLERSRFRVRDAVEDVCAMLAGDAHAKGVELVCYVDENVPSLADGDGTRLRQVLDNLVRNAIAFTIEGEIVVRMSRVEERGGRSLYRCDVQDTGCGIAPELQMTMFDAFTQEDGTRTRRHGGLGMGLTISRELVGMMGGEITFRSRLAEGTRFTFTVELGDVDDVEAEESERRDSIRGARALVVDDNETNRTILYHQLSGWGLLTDTADSGEAALTRLQTAAANGARYDVLVLDLHMPGMDGVELARRIHADPALSGIRSLMLTSALLDLDTEELARLGIDRYISKPPRQSVLHDSLVSLLPAGGIDRASLVDVESAPVPISAHVLLAEDNLVSQDVAVSMLESVGCRVDVAPDGEEALTLADETRYDLILMDCRMPRRDGYETTAAIRSGEGPNAATPIVALTANAMQGDRERCLDAGMDDYLSKPVRADDLRAMLMRRVELVSPEVDTDGAKTMPIGERPDDTPTSAPAAAAPLDGDEKGDTVVSLARSTPAVPARSAPAKPESEVRGGDGATAEASRDADSAGERPVREDAATETASTDEAPRDGNDTTAEASRDADSAADRPVREDAATEDAPPPINPAALDAIRGLQRPGKPDLLKKVLGAFLEQTPPTIAAMRAALDASDSGALKEQAHSLKSSSAYVGAEGLSHKCRRIERAVSEGEEDALETLVCAIESEYERVAAELGGMRDAA